MISVWLYSIASFFSLAALLAAQHLGNGAHMQFTGESLGLIIVLLSCQICFHLNGVDELLDDSKTQIFLQRVLKSAGAGLLLAVFVFYIFPKLSPGYATATASASFLIFSLVVLRPIVRSVVRREESESTVMVGSESILRKLYNEIADQEVADHLRVTQYSDLSHLAQHGMLSRVVVAESDMQLDSTAAQALIDLKLRGI